MFQKWTKFNNVLLWFSIVAWLIVVIVFTCNMANDHATKDFAWVVGVGGTFLVFAAHALWGLFIEMAKNIIVMSAKSFSTVEKGNTQTGYANNVINDMIKTTWKCKNCGKENSAYNRFCEDCGCSKTYEPESEDKT